MAQNRSRSNSNSEATSSGEERTLTSSGNEDKALDNIVNTFVVVGERNDPLVTQNKDATTAAILNALSDISSEIGENFVAVHKENMPEDIKPFSTLEKCDLKIHIKTNDSPISGEIPQLIINNKKFILYGYKDKKWQETELILQRDEKKYLEELAASNTFVKQNEMDNRLLKIVKKGHEQINWLARNNDHTAKSAHTVLKIELNNNGKKETHFLKKCDGKKDDVLPEFEVAAGKVQHAISGRFVADTTAYYDDETYKIIAITSKAIPYFKSNKENPLTKEKIQFQDIKDIEVEIANSDYDDDKDNLIISLGNLSDLLEKNNSAQYSQGGWFSPVSNLFVSAKKGLNYYGPEALAGVTIKGKTAEKLKPEIDTFLKDNTYSKEKYEALKHSLEARLASKYATRKCWLYCSDSFNLSNPQLFDAINSPAFVYDKAKKSLNFIDKKNPKTPIKMLIPKLSSDENEIATLIDNILSKTTSNNTSNSSQPVGYELTPENWILLAEAGNQEENEELELYKSIKYIKHMIANPPQTKILNPELIEKFENLDKQEKNTHYEQKHASDETTLSTQNDIEFKIKVHDYLVYRRLLSTAFTRVIKFFIGENDDHNKNFGEEGMFDYDHSIGPISHPLHNKGWDYEWRKPTTNTFKLLASYWHLFPDSNCPETLPFYTPCKESHAAQSGLTSVASVSQFAHDATQNIFTPHDNEVFKSLPNSPFFVYYKNLAALKIMLMDTATFSHYLAFNIRKNWKLTGEIYGEGNNKLSAKLGHPESPEDPISTDSLIACIKNWLDNRVEEFKRELTKCPEFRDFLKYHATNEKQDGGLVMKKIMELFQEDKEELEQQLEGKPHYEKLVATINQEEIMKRFTKIYNDTMSNTAKYEEEQLLAIRNSSRGLGSSNPSTISTTTVNTAATIKLSMSGSGSN